MFFFTYQVSLKVNNHTHLQHQPGDKIIQASIIALIISTAISTEQIPNPFQHLVLSFKRMVQANSLIYPIFCYL